MYKIAVKGKEENRKLRRHHTAEKIRGDEIEPANRFRAFFRFEIRQDWQFQQSNKAFHSK